VHQAERQAGEHDESLMDIPELCYEQHGPSPGSVMSMKNPPRRAIHKLRCASAAKIEIKKSN
jgi:hypothetical protein